MVADDETIEVPSMGGREPRVLSRQVLSEIIQPRAEEIFSLASKEIKKVDHTDMISSGIVITGGSSVMEGMVDMAEKITGMPVRRGGPANIDGLVDTISHPMYATGIGILLCALQQEGMEDRKFKNGHLFENIYKRMRNWFGGFF